MVNARFARRPSTQTSDAGHTANATAIIGAPRPFSGEEQTTPREKSTPPETDNAQTPILRIPSSPPELSCLPSCPLTTSSGAGRLVGLIDDSIPPEHRGRLPTLQLHDDAFRHAANLDSHRRGALLRGDPEMTVWDSCVLACEHASAKAPIILEEMERNIPPIAFARLHPRATKSMPWVIEKRRKLAAYLAVKLPVKSRS
jgi:hypothetical protein